MFSRSPIFYNTSKGVRGGLSPPVGSRGKAPGGRHAARSHQDGLDGLDHRFGHELSWMPASVGMTGMGMTRNLLAIPAKAGIQSSLTEMAETMIKACIQSTKTVQCLQKTGDKGKGCVYHGIGTCMWQKEAVQTASVKALLAVHNYTQDMPVCQRLVKFSDVLKKIFSGCEPMVMRNGRKWISSMWTTVAKTF